MIEGSPFNIEPFDFISVFEEDMQIILLLETNKECESDFIYLSTLIKMIYDVGRNKITPFYLNGKCNYCKEEAKIKEKISD